MLEALTGQVLSLSRATQNEVPRESVVLASVLERVAADAELEALDKRVELRWTAPSADLEVSANEALLVSAIQNVVRNAVQATPDGGSVVIDTSHDERRVRVRVTDSGAGVPESELERIFEPFYRLDTNRPGSGIGLAITARVMEQIGGSVRAQLAGSGGLEVVLELPLAR